jgi:hypothetical protein
MVQLLFEFYEGAAGQLINMIDTNIGRQRFQSIADNTHHRMIQITNRLQTASASQDHFHLFL